MMDAPPYREISPWVEPPAERCAPARHRPPRRHRDHRWRLHRLSAARNLRAAGIDVAVLEQDLAGAGASGRNAGQLSPTIGKDLPTLLRLFGRARAEVLVRFADDAVTYTEETIATLAIECDYPASGNVLAGVHPEHAARLRKAAGDRAGDARRRHAR